MIRKTLILFSLIAAAAGFLTGASSLAALELVITSPSARPGRAPETTLAPTRDFYIQGHISGERAAEVKNLIFEVFDQSGSQVRKVTTDVYTAHQALNTGDENLENHGLDLDSRPMPDLVWDGANSNSCKSTDLKAVIYQDESGQYCFAALIQGGVTKHLSDYLNEISLPLSDLVSGRYTVKVTATDAGYNSLGSSQMGLNFAFSNMAFYRFTDQRHIDNMRALSGGFFKNLDDPLPGNWRFGEAGAEIKARWKANDFLEYSFAPKVIGAVYDISPLSATQMELATVIDKNHLESSDLNYQTYLYHYDLGDSLVEYQRRGGLAASAEGRLVLFPGSVDPFSPESLITANNSYQRLALTRTELYDQAGGASLTNINDLRFKAKRLQRVGQYSLGGSGASLIFSRPGQPVGVFGVAAPIPSPVTADPGNNTPPLDLNYTVDNRLTTVKGSLAGPGGSRVDLPDTPVALVRFLPGGAYGRPSIYEFKTSLDPADLWAEGLYHLALAAYDAHGQPMDRARRNLDILVTRTGNLNGGGLPLSLNQWAVGDAFLDMLIDGNVGGPALASAYINLPRAQINGGLTDLSGAPLVHRLAGLADDPLRPVRDHLDVRPREPGGRLWANTHYRHKQVKGWREFDSFQVEGFGAALGYEHVFENGRRVGASFVLQKAESDDHGLEADLEDKALVAHWREPLPGQFRLTGLYGHSFRDYDSRRDLALGGYSERLEGRTRGRGDWLNIGLEKDLMFNDSLIFSPGLAWEGGRHEYRAFREKGGPAALGFKGRTEEYQFLAAGGRVEAELGELILGLKARHSWRMKGDDRAWYAAGLRGADGFAYDFEGRGAPGVNRSWDLGLAFSWPLTEGSRVALGYDGRFNRFLRDHRLTAEIGWQWR